MAFDKRITATDDYGNENGAWDEQLVVWARVRPLIGGENVQAARLAGTQPVVITVHSSSQTRQIEPEWRGRNARTGTIYNIRSIANNDEQNAYLDITATAGQAV